MTLYLLQDSLERKLNDDTIFVMVPVMLQLMTTVRQGGKCKIENSAAFHMQLHMHEKHKQLAVGCKSR